MQPIFRIYANSQEITAAIRDRLELLELDFSADELSRIDDLLAQPGRPKSVQT